MLSILVIQERSRKNREDKASVYIVTWRLVVHVHGDEAAGGFDADRHMMYVASTNNAQLALLPNEKLRRNEAKCNPLICSN